MTTQTAIDFSQYSKAQVKEEARLLLLQLKGRGTSITGFNSKTKAQLISIYKLLRDALSARGGALMASHLVENFDMKYTAYSLGAELSKSDSDLIEEYKTYMAKSIDLYDQATNV